MTVKPRDILLSALRCEPTERVPWLPYVGCHGGQLVGLTATDYLRDPAAIANGVAAATERYRPDGLPVIFDLQVEAEALGCELRWSDDNPPAVTSHPLSAGVALDDLAVPDASAGRFPVVLDAIARSRQAVGDEIALLGLITGPFTLALHLMGHDIFMQMFLDPAKVNQVMEFCSLVGRQVADWYVDAGCDVIAVVDPMTSQISPDHFGEFVHTPSHAIFSHLTGRQVPSSFFVCGDAQKNVAKMCETGCSSVCVDENIDLTYVGEIAREHGIAFGGNMPLTTVLLFGSPDDCRRSARQCLDLGGAIGYILAPGCDLPYAVPAANLEAVAEVVHGEHSGIVADAAAQTFDVEVPDYAANPLVRIDIFTLDSAACAPCQYMVEAVRAATPEFEGQVEWVEHKLKTPETVGLMTALGVTAIPSILIDGEVAFSSLIPEERTLLAAIQQKLDAKPR